MRKECFTLVKKLILMYPFIGEVLQLEREFHLIRQAKALATSPTVNLVYARHSYQADPLS